VGVCVGVTVAGGLAVAVGVWVGALGWVGVGVPVTVGVLVEVGVAPPSLLDRAGFDDSFGSHPIPSRSASKLCGSGWRTVKLESGMSSQSRSVAVDGIQIVG
jgi:hypothetical protein